MAKIDIPTDLDKAGCIVTLLFGTMAKGGMYWCYAAVKPSRYEQLKKAVAGKAYDIRNFENDGYGKIVVSGEGGLPPVGVTKQVAAMFNVPIRSLFADVDPQAAIARGLEKLAKEAEEKS